MIEIEKHADPLDTASDYSASVVDYAVAAAMRAAADIPKGKAGECLSCGVEHLRLINGNCIDCRQAFGLMQ